MDNWFVLPFLIEFLNSGDFTFREKCLRSLRNNIPYLVLYLVAFIAVIIILATTKSGQEALAHDGITGCLIGLSTVFGLLFIVILLGYGLVQIPFSYMRYVSLNKKVRELQYKVA